MKNLSNLIQILQKSQIDFVIVGDYSAAFHGSSIITQGLEVCIDFTEDNIQKLKTCLSDFYPVHRMTPQKLSFLDHPKSLENLKNLYLQTDLGIVDILGLVGGVGEFSEVKKNALEIDFFGKPCFILSIEDLIKAKKFMGRPKDLMTIKELECLKNK